jgi:hypothetical protein
MVWKSVDSFDFLMVVLLWALMPLEYNYLRHVSLEQFAKQFKRCFVDWLLGSLIVCVIFLIYQAVHIPSFDLSVSLPVPKPIWFIVGVLLVTWILRGQKIELCFPKATPKQWVLFNVIILVGMAMLLVVRNFLPDIAKICVLVAALQSFLLYEKLIEIGKHKGVKQSDGQPEPHY